MSRVTHHGHGIYCELCQEVYDDTDACDHRFDSKEGVKKHEDGGYITDPAGMGHIGPHEFIEVDELPMCAECGAVKLPVEKVEFRGEAA